MNTITVVLLLLFLAAWLVAFTVSFFRVDRPDARSGRIVVGNLVQALFHIILPLVPIAKSFDNKIPQLELKAYKIFSISFASLVVVVALIEGIARL
jgi:hypothetical protein